MDLSLVYFPSAVTLGALHALEPGHAKTLTAAYLIGTKGTKRDATILGFSVAITHSIVVVGLCLGAILAGREAFTGEASHYLALGSSIAVILLGLWLLRKRIRALMRASSIIAEHHHSHAPNPVALEGNLYHGEILIAALPQGERFQLRLDNIENAKISVLIDRAYGTVEKYDLIQDPADATLYLSEQAPAEPHEFSATVGISASRGSEHLYFEVHEPEHHHNHGEQDHALLSDEEHTRAHTATLPDYVERGERPSFWQIVAFGAAGGLVPCPAAVSVMLLSLSLGQSGKGLVLVLGFGIGLSITLIGVGLLIVTGISKFASGGRLSKFSAYAPVIAASMVIFSGAIGLLVSLFHGVS